MEQNQLQDSILFGVWTGLVTHQHEVLDVVKLGLVCAIYHLHLEHADRINLKNTSSGH